MITDDNITELLERLHLGDLNAVSQILPRVHGELRRIARTAFKNQRLAEALDTSDLVQDAAMRIFVPEIGPWKNRAHFFAVAAINIRRCLVDRARACGAQKRGGAWIRVDLDDSESAATESMNELLDVDAALSRLEQLNPRQAKVVELRIFGGMSVEETADRLDISETTVKMDWRVATAFLRRELAAYSDAAPLDTN